MVFLGRAGAWDHGGMLSVRDLAVEVGGRFTLQHATFTVRAGEKVGVVGRNGAGKTSMFKVLGGENPAAGGSVKYTGALGYLSQDPRRRDGSGATEASALAHILSGRGLDEAAKHLEKLRLAIEEDPSDSNISRFTKAEDAFANDGGYEAEADVRRIVHGLGLAADRVDRQIDVLSGGERRRVELARILFAGSDLLMLDEPTNHLDNDAKTWLMGFLRTYRGALLVVSHDLDLLDTAITRVLHLDEGTLVEYKGTYSQYRSARAKDEVILARKATLQTKEIERLSKVADSIRATATLSKKAKNIDHRVARLEADRVVGPKAERRLRVKFPPPPHSGRVVLEVTDLAKSYGGPPVFEDVSFAIERGERLLVLGLNGAGKTSLLRILASVPGSEADLGDVHFGFGVSTGYYAQEHENLKGGMAVLDHLRQDIALPDTELRSLLGMFGITGEMAWQDALTLSGGEKTKLSLALLVAGRHNLLLLDEPTNNLDPPSREAVGAALATWPGAMVIVSHDAEFVKELNPQRVLMMPDGTLDYWTDDLIELVEMA